MSGDERCTPRKHVIEKGARFCDCGRVLIRDTAAANAQVVTLMPAVLRDRERT